MNNLLEFRKRMTQKEAHDYVSERHRVEMEKEVVDFNRFMWKWLAGLAIIVFLIGVGAAVACDDLGETDGTIKQIRVDAL